MQDTTGHLRHPGSEPILNNEDHRIWSIWKRVCLLHARTAGHQRKVDAARNHIAAMHTQNPGAYLAWSAGKDSTAMTHLASTVVSGMVAMSVKDDCDFPGEQEYLIDLAGKWGINLDIVTPEFSLMDKLKELQIDPGEDIHSRTSAFSESFYSLVESYRQEHGLPGVYLGLRKGESHARRMNRTTRGTTYIKLDGEVVCTPIVDWCDLDVFAYLFSNDIEPLHVYRCVRLAESPAMVRKSWWVPGSAARYGQTVWLRTYYPSLYNKLKELMPSSSCYA